MDRWLTSILAFHPDSADRPWLFYEEIDRYLGPWKETGYPIAYGKKYCVLFYGDRVLRDNPAGDAWVERTLLILQVELKSFILDRYRHGTLAGVTEAQLRAAAFASHPKAYTKGGLTMVVLLQPNLVAQIAAIPHVEFKPTAPTFGASIRQAIDTTGIVVTEAIAQILAVASGPAHNQMLQVATARDQQKFQGDLAVSQRIAALRAAVRAGRCDHLDLLTRLKQGVELTLFVNRSANTSASTLVHEIDVRSAQLTARYAREVGRDPTLRPVYGQFDEDSCGWDAYP